MKNILTAFALCALLSSCGNNTAPREQTAENTPSTAAAEPAVQWNGYTKVKAMDIEQNAVKLVAKDWMLITAGDETSFNTMTASWGALGELWAKPVFISFVRDSRYTHRFLEANEYYTLCFFDEPYREKLQLLGSKSGRDTDKVKESGLTPVATPKGSMAFGEARMIIECKKLYSAPFDRAQFDDSEIYEAIYTGHETGMHTQYIGQIVNVWVK